MKFKIGDIIFSENSNYNKNWRGAIFYFVIDAFFYPHYVYHGINSGTSGMTCFEHLEKNYKVVSKIKKLLLPYDCSLHEWTKQKYEQAISDIASHYKYPTKRRNK